MGELSYQFPECQLLIWYLSHQKWPCIAVVLGSFLVGVDNWWNLPRELNQLVQGQHDTTSAVCNAAMASLLPNYLANGWMRSSSQLSVQ